MTASSFFVLRMETPQHFRKDSMKLQLTGKRVVFLVDMSGSMELVDETTPAPSKWTGVRETLVKIMRSLPELDKFQIIIFSDKSSFLFGGNGKT